MKKYPDLDGNPGSNYVQEQQGWGGGLVLQCFTGCPEVFETHWSGLSLSRSAEGPNFFRSS